MNLKDRHVLVTGGSKGIGAAIAKALSSEGARLSLVARPSAALDETAKRLNAHSVPADLSDPASHEGLIETAQRRHGPVDILVNCAALGATRHYATLSARDVRDVVITNLLAPMELSRQLIVPMLRRNEGAILNISSVTGEFAMPSTVAYASTKSGLTMFSLNLQRDVRHSKVNISAFVLGAVPDTQIYNEGVRNPAVRRLAEQIGKLFATLKPDEIALRVVKSLQSDKQGLVVMPRSAEPAIRLRLAPVWLGDQLFSRGRAPHDPELLAVLKEHSDR